MKFKNLFLITLVLGALISCTKDDIGSFTENKLKSSSDDFQDKILYDVSIEKVAKSLSKLLINENIRELLKEEALKKTDGDYDIIWKDLYPKANNKGQMVDIKDLLRNQLTTDSKDELKASTDLSKFFDKFKQFQISIPVNCESWDTKNFVPPVVFLTNSYDESQEYVQSFDSNGVKHNLSNKYPPKYPVIVLSLNERSYSNGDIKETYKDESSVRIIEPGDVLLVPPTGLVATSSIEGVLLNWDPYPEDNPNISLSIERYENNEYITLATANIYNRSYYDRWNLVTGRSYVYRISAIDRITNTVRHSSSVQILYTPRLPKPLNFLAVNEIPNFVSFTWENTVNTLANNGSIVIERRLVGSSSWFEVLRTNELTNSAFDLSLTMTPYPNNQYTYQIYYDFGTGGRSDSDFEPVFNSERSRGQKLVLTHIKVDDLAEIESWVKGAPEFVYNVGTMSKTNEKVMLQSNLKYEPQYRYPHYGPSIPSDPVLRDFLDKNCIYNGNITLVSAWDNDFHNGVMAVNMVEEDNELIGSVKIQFGLQGVEKLAQFFNIGAEGISTELSFKSGTKNLGTVYLFYWDNPTKTISFNQGVTARFSNNYIYGPWQTNW